MVRPQICAYIYMYLCVYVCVQSTLRRYVYTTYKISFNLKRYLPSNAKTKTVQWLQMGGEEEEEEKSKSSTMKYYTPILLKRSVCTSKASGKAAINFRPNLHKLFRLRHCCNKENSTWQRYSIFTSNSTLPFYA